VSNEATEYNAIILMGVSGCGKSTVGRLLADELGCRFIEGDEFHSDSNIAKMRAGHPLTDADRWPWLDRIGKAMQIEMAKSRVAVASCSALKQDYRDRLVATIGVPTAFVLLDVDQAELLTRLQTRSDHFMPVSLLESQLASLERPTHEDNALILDAGASPMELCKAIRQWMEFAHPNGNPVRQF